MRKYTIAEATNHILTKRHQSRRRVGSKIESSILPSGSTVDDDDVRYHMISGLQDLSKEELIDNLTDYMMNDRTEREIWAKNFLDLGEY